MYAAKLVYNTNDFTQIAGLAQSGLGVNVPINGRNSYNIGFEEWLNNDFLKQHKLGYLDCYRDAAHIDIVDVGLFMYDTQDRNIYSVGKLCGVQQLTNGEIEACRVILMNGGFIDTVQHHFNDIGDNRQIHNNPNHEYWNCFNNNNIVAKPGENFILNIRYDSIEIFNNPHRNLTALTKRKINNWKRLRNRNTMPLEWELYFM